MFIIFPHKGDAHIYVNQTQARQYQSNVFAINE